MVAINLHLVTLVFLFLMTVSYWVILPVYTFPFCMRGAGGQFSRPAFALESFCVGPLEAPLRGKLKGGS